MSIPSFLSSCMPPSLDSHNFPLSWEYPSSGPAPPTPVVVDTVPEYFGGRPTPPPSPPKMRATAAVDDYAPCPPTPHCDPSDVAEDSPKWSNALSSGTSQSTSSGYRSTLELDYATCFVDPLTALASYNSNDPDPCDIALHVSDRLVYARDEYAYPSPVLTMIERAKLDLCGLRAQSIDLSAYEQPSRLFSLTAGYTQETGLEESDEQSFDYYVVLPSASPFCKPGCFSSDYFSIGTIQALQHDLPVKWCRAFPEPIPPVIIRLHDFVGPYNLTERHDGCAFVIPTDDSIWSTICQRGIDSTFRPINPSATVETDVYSKDSAQYYPQHIVASQFAVNVFLEIPDSDGLAPTPLCEYLGAYVLQVDGLTTSRSIWADIDPEVQQSVIDRVPDHVQGTHHPSLDWPRLPHVQFLYYKWDQCIVGLADTLRNRDILVARRVVVPCEAESEGVYRDGYSDFLDFGFDTDDEGDVDQDGASTSKAYSPEPEEDTSSFRPVSSSVPFHANVCHFSGHFSL